VIKDGASYVMYYAGLDSSGTAKIGRATAPAPSGPYTRGPSPVLDVGTASEFDATSVKDPVVVKAGAGDYRMLYTGVETLEGNKVERVGYATSSDGISWTKRGVAAGPSLSAYASDESGLEATGMLIDGATLHVWTSGVDRNGRTRGGHASTPYPTPVTPQPGIPSGWATYQLGDATTTNRDFRQITRTSTGSGVTLWMSFLQPYSANGDEFWSDYFPVTVSSASEALNFLLTVHGVRWQARLSTPDDAPVLDKVELTHAPVSFSPTGSATTTAIGPSSGRVVSAWRTLTTTMSIFAPGGGGSGSATVRLLDATTGQQVASAALVSGTTTVDLAGVPAASHQSLTAAFDLQSTDGTATPRIGSLTVTYDSATAPPPPLPPSLSFLAAPKTIVFGKSVGLSGNLNRGGVPQAGQSVTLAAQPIGAPTFTPLPTAMTDAAGNYGALVKPTKRTTYQAGFGGLFPTVVVLVKHKLTLKGKRRSGKVYLNGTVGPKHVRRVVVIQRKKGTRWVTIARVRTTRRSTFKLVRKAPAKRALFRAKIGADKEHLANLSRSVRA
jgi:hypothetical protein